MTDDRASPRIAAPVERPRWFVPAVLAVTGLAAALALWGLDHDSLWRDEGVSLRFVRSSWWNAPFRDNGNTALYLLLLKAWYQVFKSEAGVRLLSVLAFVATVPVVAQLGRRLLGPVAGIAAAAIVAVNTESILWAHSVRGYSLELFLITLSALLLVAGVVDHRRSALFLAAGVGVLAAYAHPLGAVVIGALLVSLWWLPRSALAVRPSALLGIVVALVVPLAFVLARAGRSQIAWEGTGGYGRLLVTALNVGGGKKLGIPIVALALVGAALGGAAVRRSGRTVAGWLALVPLAWIGGTMLVVLVVSIRQSLIADRYLLTLLPAMAVLIARCVQQPRWGRAASAVLVVSLLGAAAVVVSRHGDTDQEDLRGAEAAIASRAQAGDGIVFNPTSDAATVAYYLERSPTTFPDPLLPTGTWGNLAADGDEDDPARYLELLGHTDGPDRVWFVNSEFVTDVAAADIRAVLGRDRVLVETIHLNHLDIELYARRGRG